MIDNLAVRECLIRVARSTVGSPAQRAEYQVDEKAAREACGNLGGHTEVFWLAGVEELLEEGYRIE